MTHPGDEAFAQSLLPLVSRTFAPAIDRLPDGARGSVRLAYLLFRVADTLEDSPALPGAARAERLVRFASLLSTPFPSIHEETASAMTSFSAIVRDDSAESRLVEGLPALIRLFEAQPRAVQEPIRHRVVETALGMARFVRLEKEPWTSLESCGELDAYEYYVAGTVGALLDEIFAATEPEIAATIRADSRHRAILLGLGLQGTNILQDLSVDRARGWSYIPEEIAARHGAATRELGDPAKQAPAIAVVREMAARALRHLEDGFPYILDLPPRTVPIRMFCLWPVLLALRTLGRLVTSPAVLYERVRIARAEVKELADAGGSCRSNEEMTQLFLRERDAVAAAIGEPLGKVGA